MPRKSKTIRTAEKNADLSVIGNLMCSINLCDNLLNETKVDKKNIEQLRLHLSKLSTVAPFRSQKVYMTGQIRFALLLVEGLYDVIKYLHMKLTYMVQLLKSLEQ